MARLGTADQPNGRSATSSKAAPADARPRNRTLLLQALHTDGPQSRADLARVQRADADHRLGGDGRADRRRPDRRGRSQGQHQSPASRRRCSPSSPTVATSIALDLSDDDVIEAAVVNLAGKIVARRSQPAQRRDRQEGRRRGRAPRSRHRPRPSSGRCSASACATPGIVDDDGVVLTAAHVAVDERAARRQARPTRCRRAVLRDQRRQRRGARRVQQSRWTHRPSNLLLVRVGGGVGAGIVIGGELFVGDHFAAGEIGHVVVDDDGALCKCGRRRLPRGGRVGAAARATPRTASATPIGRAHLEQAGRHLGIALATLVGALNLSEIVLSGPMDLLDDRFRIAALETIRNRTFPTVGQHVTARFSSLGDDGVLLGAAALVLRNELGVV